MNFHNIRRDYSKLLEWRLEHSKHKMVQVQKREKYTTGKS